MAQKIERYNVLLRFPKTRFTFKRPAER